MSGTEAPPAGEAPQSQGPDAKPHLYAALAKLQASLPRVTKDERAKVTSDKGSYTYTYADLATVSAAVMPRLGKLGLAFTARPTMRDGKFVLAYSLVHESGEREDGEYPLPAAGSPQQIGSAITYARRYALCAVTGVAPDDDDDAQAAEQGYRHPAARNGNGSQVRRPAPDRNGDGGEAALGDWAVTIDGITSREDAAKADTELRDMFRAGKIDAGRANQIRDAIKAKVAQVTGGAVAEAAQ